LLFEVHPDYAVNHLSLVSTVVAVRAMNVLPSGKLL